MVGSLHTPPFTATVGPTSKLIIASPAPKGGFPSLRHNEVRDLTARLLTEVCHEVRVEPNLQPITGETLSRATSNTQDGARLDMLQAASGGGKIRPFIF